MDYSALIGALAGVLVLLISKGIELMKARRQSDIEERDHETKNRIEERKQSAEVSIPVNEQAVKIYKDLVESLKTDLANLRKGMSEQDIRYIEARETALKLRVQLEAAEREIAILKQQSETLEQEAEALRIRVVELETLLEMKERDGE